MNKLTSVGFGRPQPSKDNRRGEWVVVEAVLEYGEETGEFVEVFIGSRRECMDFRDFNDTYSNLDILPAD
jgi:hypothetical protein